MNEAAGAVVLIVRDHGPGIAQGDFDKLFEPYRQGRSSPWSTQQGFGLGLYVVKNWIERMGGRVEADNHPQGGARFAVTLLPFTAADAASTETEA